MAPCASDALIQSAVFAGVAREVVDALCGRGQRVSFEANHELFQRGQSADELLILQEGTVELLFPVQIMGVTRTVTMESKHAGEVVAWSAVVSPYRFTLSARCTSECTLTSFSRDTLHTFFEMDPQTGYLFMRNLAGVIGRRLQAMQTIWMRDLQESASKRLG